jgi:poly-gamma-glutamate synthesis protein (capsule biosynthesis protein)
LGTIFFVACRNQDEVRILITGDILLSRQVKQEYNYRNESPWNDLKSLFQTADLVIGNLEGAVGTVSKTMDTTASPVFAIDSSDIAFLSEAGFTMMGIENNHSGDLGYTGKQNTLTQLLKNKIHPVGFENSPYFITVKGIVFSIITVNTIPDRNNSEKPVFSIELKQKLNLAKTLSHIVIVSIHWGSELLEWSDKKQRKMAKWLIAQGADIIVGSHPHVIQKPEIIDGKPVFFSLGNHLFDQKYPATKKGMIAEITLKNGKYKCKGIITHTKPNSFYPELEAFVSFDFPEFRYNHKLFNVNEYSLIPVSIFEQNNYRIVLQAYSHNRLMWRSHPLPLLYITSSKLNENEEYIVALQNYYSTIDKEINLRPYVYSVTSQGMNAQWRGSALAYPLIDAYISSYNPRILCAWHRGDSYIALDKEKPETRMAVYEWNGFGFRGLPDSLICKYCNHAE